MDKAKGERLEDIQAINVQLLKEKKHSKEKVHMFHWKKVDINNNIDNSTRLFTFLKKRFIEHQDSLTIVMEDQHMSRVQLVQLDKVKFRWIIGKRKGSLR